MLESRFNQVASLKACNFIKKRFQHRYDVVVTGTILQFGKGKSQLVASMQ